MDTYYEYLRNYSQELGARIVEMYPPVQGPNDLIAAPIATLLRKPLPAQALTISGLAKHLKTACSVRIVGECGIGKTLMSMGVAHAHADGTPYSTIAMCPPHLVLKWAREVLITVPRVRAFVILCAIEHRAASIGEVFNTVSSQALTLRGYAEAMYRWFEREPRLSFAPFDQWKLGLEKGDAEISWGHIMRSSCVSIEKSRQRLGYSPRFSSLEAIQQSVAALI
ncbi:MAG TPA: hypothetical protein VGI45_06600, partial [Terracidiphilus sp.]